MNIRLNVALHKAISELNEKGFKAYLVGGGPRDYLLGKLPGDLDITTDANKEEIIDVFHNYKTVDVGTKFGTVLVVIAGINFEITPHRFESSYLDHRHPSEIYFIKDLKEDLSRRDFTMNAIAFSNDDGLIDYFGGIQDINDKIIRSVGEPNKRFEEDALRILRAIRFSFTLDFEIEEETKKAIFTNANLLEFISIERKLAELKKTLSTNNIYPRINEYKDVLNTFIAVNDTDETINNFENWRLKLAYLLDDSFIDKLGTLKLSNDDTKLIKTLMTSKNLDFSDDYIFCKTLSETTYKDDLIEFKSIIDKTDYKDKADKLSLRIIDDILVSGNHLIEKGYKGKIIGRIQNDLKDKVYKGELKNSRPVLLEYVAKQYNGVMELRRITKEEYLEYYKNFDYSHFMQSPGFGEVYETRGYEVYYLAFIKNNECEALCMTGKKKILSYSSFYAPRGILVDYNNKDTLKEVIKELKTFLKKEKALYFKMDPGIVIRKRDLNSEIIETYDSINFLDSLKELGFKHRGFSFDLVDSSQPRFTFRLNMDREIDDILKGMSSTNKKIFKRGFPELVITKNKIDEIPLFYETMKDTAIRENLFLPDISFYSNFYELLHKYDASDLYVASVEINKIIERDNIKITDLNDEISKLKSKDRVTTKDENLISKAEGEIAKLNKELFELDVYKDQKLALSSVITAKDKDKVWLIFGGNRNILKILNANYYLYWDICKDAKAEGYKIVDFFGSHGKPTTDNAEYGIFLYKSKFGGDFLEFIGEFDLIINKTMNFILMSLVKARRKIKQKI